jgi:hypothetical protein
MRAPFKEIDPCRRSLEISNLGLALTACSREIEAASAWLMAAAGALPAGALAEGSATSDGAFALEFVADVSAV